MLDHGWLSLRLSKDLLEWRHIDEASKDSCACQSARNPQSIPLFLYPFCPPNGRRVYRCMAPSPRGHEAVQAPTRLSQKHRLRGRKCPRCRAIMLSVTHNRSFGRTSTGEAPEGAALRQESLQDHQCGMWGSSMREHGYTALRPQSGRGTLGSLCLFGSDSGVFKIGGCADCDGEGDGDSCFANVPILRCSDVNLLREVGPTKVVSKHIASARSV